MADVAQRTSRNFAAVPAEADYVHERSVNRTRRSYQTDGVDSGPSGRRSAPQWRVRGFDNREGQATETTQRAIAMEVVVQPPANAPLGMAFNRPVTVRLSSWRPYDTNDADIPDINSLVAIATLTTAGSEPVNPQVLLGHRVDSVHPIPGEDGYEGGGYVSFPDLAIIAEGTFKIRVTLVKMANPYGSHVQAIDSHPFTIMRPPSDSESGKWI